MNILNFLKYGSSFFFKRTEKANIDTSAEASSTQAVPTLTAVPAERERNGNGILSAAGKAKILVRQEWIHQKHLYLFESSFHILHADGKEFLQLQQKMAELLDKIEIYAVPEEGEKAVIGFKPAGIKT